MDVPKNRTLPLPLPLPPESASAFALVRIRWVWILDAWKRGWAADKVLEELESFLEGRRIEVFVNRSLPPEFDWVADWFQADALHRQNIDLVQNRKTQNEELRKLWSEWAARVNSNGAAVGLEALKAIIIIDGAAIIASLAVLSGQITDPTKGAVIAASITMLTSVAGMMMMATGQAIIVHSSTTLASTVRGALVVHARHSRLYAIDRLLRRYLTPKLQIGEALIYGSIGLFGLSAFISSVVVITVR